MLQVLPYGSRLTVRLTMISTDPYGWRLTVRFNLETHPKVFYPTRKVKHAIYSTEQKSWITHDGYPPRSRWPEEWRPLSSPRATRRNIKHFLLFLLFICRFVTLKLNKIILKSHISQVFVRDPRLFARYCILCIFNNFYFLYLHILLLLKSTGYITASALNHPPFLFIYVSTKKSWKPIEEE